MQMMETELRALRGAVSVENDNPPEIADSVVSLIKGITDLNGLTKENIRLIQFSVTGDIHSLNPAKAWREASGWSDVPLFCSLEPDFIGMPQKIIRVLIWTYVEKGRVLKPLYLGRSASLRPDYSK